MNDVIRHARLFAVLDHIGCAKKHLALFPNTAQAIEQLTVIEQRLGHMLVDHRAIAPPPTEPPGHRPP